jgi:menaquinone-9 beta-reductase
MDRHFDVIVVGARCAGAALSTYLSRAGARVLLLEAAARATDMPMSTHFVQPPGMDVLDVLGVGDRLRGVAPPSRTICSELDGVRLLGTYPDNRSGHCVRRLYLDSWLQEAAEAAGVDFRDQHRVVGLPRDGERVSGVVVQTPRGTETFSANRVVGADGQHSTVAKLAGAQEYLVTDGTRAGYWAYYPAPERWDADWDVYIGHDGDTLRYVFRCDGSLLLIGALEPRAIGESWGKNYRAKLHESLLSSPVTAPLVAGKEPVGRVLGLLRTRFFYRCPIGPGIALAGDAGHFKDFVTGQGITDALLDAERLAPAILEDTELALERYWRERDLATLPLHFDALQQGVVGFNDAFMRFVFERMGRDRMFAARSALVADRKLQPSEVLPVPTLLRWMLAALGRGRFDVISGFLRAGRVQSERQRELRKRVALLEQVDQRIRTAAAPAPGAAVSLTVKPLELRQP